MISNSYAFFKGLSLDKFFANSTACYSDITNLTFVGTPNLKLMLADDTAEGFEKALMITRYIKNISKSVMDCNSALLNVHLYINNQIYMQDGFTNFLLATF